MCRDLPPCGSVVLRWGSVVDVLFRRASVQARAGQCVCVPPSPDHAGGACRWTVDRPPLWTLLWIFVADAELTGRPAPRHRRQHARTEPRRQAFEDTQIAPGGCRRPHGLKNSPADRPRRRRPRSSPLRHPDVCREESRLQCVWPDPSRALDRLTHLADERARDHG